MTSPNRAPAPVMPPETAVNAVRRVGDTLDVYARRLRQTEQLGTRVTLAAALPTAVEAFTSYPGLQYAVTAPVYMAAGTAMAAGVYGVSRLRQGGRVARAEAAQEAIRQELGQPVDVLRMGRVHGRRSKNRDLNLRWYGLDAAYTEDRPIDAFDVAHRYTSLVAFAKQNGMKHVTASEAILKYTKTPAAAAGFGKVTPREDLFKGRKGKSIKVTDKKADEKLLVSSIGEAEALANELVSQTDADVIDYLARALFDMNSNHPAVAAYNDWIRLKRPPELRANLARIFRSGVERNFTPDMETRRVPVMPKKVHTVKVDPDKDGKPTRATAVLPEARRVVVDPTTIQRGKKAVSKTGIKDIDPSQLTEPARTDVLMRVTGNGYTTFMNHKGVSGLSGSISDYKGASFKQMTGYDSLEQFAVAPKSDAWEYEYALFCLFDRTDTLTYQDIMQHTVPAHARPAAQQTFLQRLPEEAPRKFIVQRKYGKGASKSDHTIEYGRTPIRSRVRKLGVLAVAVALAFPAGKSLGTGLYEYGEYYAGTYECPPQEADDTAAERAKQEACMDEREAYTKDNQIIAVGEGIQEKHSALEDSLLLDAYRSGLLNDNTLSIISKRAADDWLTEKKQRIGEYANLLHDRSDSPIANDEDPSAPGSPNPVIWEVIANDSGKGTAGFWNQGVESRMSIQDFANVSGEVMPFRDAVVEVGNAGTYIYDPQTKRLGVETIGTAFTESDEVAQYDGFRKLSLRSMSEITAADKLMVVGGLQSAGNSWDIAFSPDHQNNRTHLFSLPVLVGADVKAVQVEIRDYRHDALLTSIQPEVFQLPDGSYKFVVPSGVFQDKESDSYLHIRYAIDPNASTDQLVRTTEPFHIQKRGEFAKPLDKVLTAADEAAIRKAVNAGPQDSATEVAKAWHDGHGYKYSPYAGLYGEQSVEGKSTREIMLDITNYAINMDEVNCTVSAMSTLMATRGKDGKHDLGYAVGINDDGDGKLTKIESHAKIIRDDGLQIDPTPSANDPSDKAPAITEGGKIESSPIETARDIGATAAAVGIGILLGTKGLTAVSGAVARRRRRKAEDYIVSAKATPTQLETDLALLGQLQYAPATTVIDERTATASSLLPVDGRVRNLGLSNLSAQDVKRLLQERATAGKLSISDETSKRLVKLVVAAQRTV